MLRRSLAYMPGYELPAALDASTRRRCSQILAQRSAFSRIPGTIWAALFTLTVLTIILVAPVIGDAASTGRMWSVSESPHLVFLIIQNGLMLLFAPLLIRRLRDRHPRGTQEEFNQ